MPIVEGRRVSLDEWRATRNQSAATNETDEVVEETTSAEPRPRRQRRNRGAMVAQVQAALGITPNAPPDPDMETPGLRIFDSVEDADAYIALKEGEGEPETQEPTGEAAGEASDAE